MDVLEQTGAIDRRIAELAEAQHGIVGRRQLQAIGVGREAIEVRLRAGRLHRRYRGVYSVGHQVISLRGRWMAAVLSCGSGAALSHRSAAALWGIRDPSSRAIEVTSPAKSRSNGTVERHFSRLPVDETSEEDGIPVTTVPRTIFDLAAVVPVNAVEQALRQSERLRLYDALSLEDLLRRYPRRSGARTVRECLRRRRELPGGVTREELEARFLAFLEGSGFPRPLLNAWLTIAGRRYQADCLWPEQKVIGELDGFATHGTRAAFEEDRDRDRRLVAAGYRGMRVTWSQLHEIPTEIAADLGALLANHSKYKRP